MDVGGIVYHVLNRANAKKQIFETTGDYKAFEKALGEASERVNMRILTYCIMPNHWHLVLWPIKDGDLSKFVGWLTLTHTQRWHAFHDTAGTGHLYQGRFKSFPVQSDEHLLMVCRYVERNPLRAGLVRRAEHWRWGSIFRRTRVLADGRVELIDSWPVARTKNWLEWVNKPEADDALTDMRTAVQRGRPFGAIAWMEDIAKRFDIGLTLNKRGRPATSRSFA